MKKYGLKPPRLWYQKKFITEANNEYNNEFNNLIKDVDADFFVVHAKHGKETYDDIADWSVFSVLQQSENTLQSAISS